MTVQGKQDIVIIDETEQCPYLPDEIARMPLRLPLAPITLSETDLRFAEGNRRTGEFIYQTNCPNCEACQAIRLDAEQFKFSRNQKRVLAKGNRLFKQVIGPLQNDQDRVNLFNKHRLKRGLAQLGSEIDSGEYSWGFVKSCFKSFEIAYTLDERLVCVAICDEGEHSISAVYTFYDPDLVRESLGTYSILKQIEFCKENEFQYLYLGYYVEQSPHMEYKKRFLPHQRLIAGQWREFTE